MPENQKSYRNQPGLRDLDYHQRNCIICKHPYRRAIEEEFIHWRSPEDIACDFKINFRSVYRHAHATGLYERRRRNLRCVLETFLERAEHVRVSAREIITAARAYSRISDDGQWIEPPTTNRIFVERTENQGKRTLASLQLETPAPSEQPLLLEQVENTPAESLLTEDAASVSPAPATSESAEPEGHPDNQSQTEIDLTR